MKKLIKKDKVDDFLKNMSGAGFDVVAPVNKDGVPLFCNLEGAPELDYGNSKKPPKETFFPQTETMFDFKIEATRITGLKDPKEDNSSILLFGIRPCDARAMVVLDELFTWDYIDQYYVDRKNRATIISFGCTQEHMPLKNCFCTSVGGNPCSKEGADMLWTDIGDGYLVESLNEKGNKVLDTSAAFFQDAGANDEAKAGELQKKAEDAIVRSVSTEGVHSALESTFDHEYWDGFAKRCLGCGICTLLCPTCHCFDINDVLSRGKGKRERTWDSCQFPYYTVHASGHNPRPAKKHRQRNRVYHKFLYSEKNLDLLGCVGCGRCITLCPVNIDIIEVVEGAKEVVP